MLILMLLVLSVWVCCNSSTSSYFFCKKDVITVSDGYSVFANNDRMAESMSLPVNLTGSFHDISLFRNFSSSELSGDHIAFYAHHTTAHIYINDSCVYSDTDTPDSLHLIQPSRWYLFEIPEEDFLLRIDLHSDIPINKLPEIHNGSKSNLIYYIGSEKIIPGFIGFLVFLLGLSLLLLSFFLRSTQRSHLRWLGFISVFSGIWVFCNSASSQLIGAPLSLFVILGYGSFFALTLLVNGFLLAYPVFRKRIYMRVLFGGLCGITTVVFFLQFMGILSWSRLIWLVHIETGLSLLALLITYLLYKKLFSPQEKQIYHALILIGIFIVVDIFRYYIIRPFSVPVKYTTIGLLVMLLYLSVSVTRLIADTYIQSERNKLYKKLAFYDTMTNLKNRSAFEEEMTNLRKQPQLKGYLLIADLNNLKYINDNFGHQYRDDAIIHIAALLNKYFETIADCFRTGGDEFCVISPEISEEDFVHCYQNFIQAVTLQQDSLNYPFSVATGYGKIDESGIDACYKAVDALMYQNKRESKKSRNE